MQQKLHPSVNCMWKEFIANNKQYENHSLPESYYFCDNEKDANECAELVLQNIKRATATSVWWFEKNKEPIPKTGDLFIITDWAGIAQGIIQTTKVELVPYKDVTAEFAAIEGEGDKSLAYWQRVHWAYYTREMAPYGEKPTEEMLIACEQFKLIWS